MFDYEYWGNGTFPAHQNMALEEFFLKRAAAGKGIIRFYSFPRDAVVLGYAQANDPVKSRDGIDVTRRITGGSHIQAGKNTIAYSFAVPRDGTFSHFEDMRAYYAGQIADAVTGLGVDGLQVDNKASAITVDGRILAAHALIWGVQSALMHGLIFIDPYDADTVARRVFLDKRKIGNELYSEYAALKNLPAVSKLLDTAAAAADRTESLKNIVAGAILAKLTSTHERKEIRPKTVNESFELMKKKFSQNSWIDSRRPPFTEQEIDEIPFEELDGELAKKLGYCLFLQVRDKDFKKMCMSEV